MPQGALFKGSKVICKKREAAKRSGNPKKTKKGKLVKVPKTYSKKQEWKDNAEVSKHINATNESLAAGRVAQSGVRLRMVAAPPVLSTAHEKGVKGAKS